MWGTGKLPLFVYLWPVNVISMVYLSIALLLFTEVKLLTAYEDIGIFSWMTEGIARLSFNIDFTRIVLEKLTCRSTGDVDSLLRVVQMCSS